MEILHFNSTQELREFLEQKEKEGYKAFMSVTHDESDRYPGSLTSQVAAALCADGFVIYTDLPWASYRCKRSKERNENGQWSFQVHATNQY